MRIAQLAPLEETVPPNNYGGTELIVNLLTEGLVERGHEVTLFASGDSITKGRLITVTKRSLRTDNSIPIRLWPAYDMSLLLQLEQHQEEFDIVHNHMGYQALPVLKNLKCPTVTTNHNPIKEYCQQIYLAFKHLPYVAISNAYRELNYPNQLNYVATIYNGIDIDRYVCESAEREKKYLLFIGRLCHDKGTLSAIEMAKALRLPIKIAGKIDTADHQYFEEKIKPLINNKDVEYLGEVNIGQKIALYSKANAVLCPIVFDEPFGLVMAESLAMGVPVAALNRGAVKEIIKDGETGIVGETVDELIRRFSEIEHISSQACRKRAAQLFSAARMVAEYEALYNKLCNVSREKE